MTVPQQSGLHSTYSAPRAHRAKRLLTLALAGAAIFGLAACSSEPLAESYQATGDQGYVAGDGSWQVFPVDDRDEPIAYSGETEHGTTLDSADLVGNVSVVNFWYAACPPCRAEAADLESMSQEFAADGVAFVGVNIYDQAPTIKSFNETFGVTYPSIIDVDTASVRLAFASNVPPQAIPTTLVIDRDGRVAAVIRGPINPSVLRTMITETLAEGQA